MLCEAGNRILRKCRSERKLRDKAAQSSHHVRKDSGFSTMSSATDTSSYPNGQQEKPTERNHNSNSDDRRLSEDDWNPLRLHPPMEVDRSPYIAGPGQRGQPPAPLSTGANSNHGYGEDVDIDDIIGSYGLTALRPPPPLTNRRPMFQRIQTAEMDIHEGFDFGFAGGRPPSSPNTIERHHHHSQQHVLHLHSSASPVSIAARHRRPSTASSTGSECSSILSPVHGAVGVPPTPLPTSSNQNRPRPRPAHSSSPDFLIKRGGWKRRGIVFVSEESKVTEDDAFDIP